MIAGATAAAKGKVLVVEDDAAVLNAISEVLTSDGYEVVAAADAVEGLAFARDPSIEVILTGIELPKVTGLELLKGVKQVQPEVEVIVMTGSPTLETAVEAMRRGAVDYLAKPFARNEELRSSVGQALERRALKRGVSRLETRSGPDDELIGESRPMLTLLSAVRGLAATSTTVLLRGERGTGKAAVARAMHTRGLRAGRQFVAVDCKSPLPAMLEHELFGLGQAGRFESLGGGTIYLDEVGDLSPSLQLRLLRVLQEGSLSRVDSEETVALDGRVIAGTSVDLEKMLRMGRLHSDLYSRLTAVSLTLPRLRDRSTDVPALANRFIHALATKTGHTVIGIAPEAMALLVANSWVGNVRELESVIEQAVAAAHSAQIEVIDLPQSVIASVTGPMTEAQVLRLTHLSFAEAKAEVIETFERRYLTALLAKNNGNITAAAMDAGLERSNFRRQMKGAGVPCEVVDEA